MAKAKTPSSKIRKTAQVPFGRSLFGPRGFAARYAKAHPKLKKQTAYTRARTLWDDRPSTKQYPRFTRALKRHGLSDSSARSYSKRLYALNHRYYEQRDIASERPQITDLAGETVPVSDAQLQDEWSMDFQDLWEEALGNDSWSERHEFYPQEA